MAEIIEEIYEEKFGGKKRGRFQLSRSQFRRLGGRKKLHDAFIDEVADECLELGYILIIIEDIIAVIEENVVLNYRSVPKSIINSYIEEDDDDDEDENYKPEDDDD
ncbi:hypothetical protein [Desulfobacter latus]|uniref:Uncharacterized protein n=1 Tax=Desulfobacter latus TaxID=2292 RepID=A0A850T022_9BACT|nr:hypothetical protein [Desulfobacter latus]NWH05700.1 hypothetical protein [Desulfobacter latus]